MADARPVLWFLFVPGCPACGASKPHLSRWEKKHPQFLVRRVDLLASRWIADWTPKNTPTWVVDLPGRRRVMHEGALDAGGIDRLIAAAVRQTGGGRMP